jgi:putative phosphoribosyl transferase
MRLAEDPRIGGNAMSTFEDRRAAGRKLAAALGKEKSGDTIVLALPRGGVPVAYEVALALGAPLDVFVVRKLGVPGEEELAMGALASGGLIVLNEEIVRSHNISAEDVADVARTETHELTRREQVYRGGRPPVNVADKTVTVVDDGLATGATMRAALRALRKGTPARLIVAVPIAAPETCAEIAGDADETICVLEPQAFRSVSDWYRDFSETSDGEVRELLEHAWRTEPERTPAPVDLRGELTSSNRR